MNHCKTNDELYRLVDHAIGLRISLRSACPNHPKAQEECTALTKVRLSLYELSVDELQQALSYQTNQYKREQEEFKMLPVAEQSDDELHEQRMIDFLENMAVSLNRMSKDENYRQQVAAMATITQNSTD